MPPGVAALLRRLGPPGVPFLVAAPLTAGVLVTWDVFLLSHQPEAAQRIGLGVAAAVALALSCEEPRRLVADVRSWFGRIRWPFVAAAVALLGLGLAYRLRAWPSLLLGGDSSDYERMAVSSARAHAFVSVPWRTPGYSFPVAEVYSLAGIANHGAVHAWQVGLSLLTALLVMAIAYQLTRSRVAALLALAVACLAFPMAVASAFLMSEVQAMLLAALAVFLLLAVHQGRGLGAAMLALGPTLGLAYETRTAMAPFAAVVAAAALAAPRAGWRQRVVLVGALALTLAPMAVLNAQGPYQVVTAGPAVDLLSENLGQDRFSMYGTAPNSPGLLDQFHEAIVADGAETDYWVKKRPAQVAAFTRDRLGIMTGYIQAHWASYVGLSLRRLPLFFRYDQSWDMTGSSAQRGAWLLAVDALLALAVVAVGTWLARRRWRPVLLVGLPLLALWMPLALFHVEPRYGLPALPLVVALAAP